MEFATNGEGNGGNRRLHPRPSVRFFFPKIPLRLSNRFFSSSFPRNTAGKQTHFVTYRDLAAVPFRFGERPSIRMELHHA